MIALIVKYNTVAIIQSSISNGEKCHDVRGKIFVAEDLGDFNFVISVVGSLKFHLCCG